MKRQVYLLVLAVSVLLPIIALTTDVVSANPLTLGEWCLREGANWDVSTITCTVLKGASVAVESIGYRSPPTFLI